MYIYIYIYIFIYLYVESETEFNSKTTEKMKNMRPGRTVYQHRIISILKDSILILTQQFILIEQLNQINLGKLILQK